MKNKLVWIVLLALVLQAQRKKDPRTRPQKVEVEPNQVKRPSRQATKAPSIDKKAQDDGKTEAVPAEAKAKESETRVPEVEPSKDQQASPNQDKVEEKDFVDKNQKKVPKPSPTPSAPPKQPETKEPHPQSTKKDDSPMKDPEITKEDIAPSVLISEASPSLGQTFSNFVTANIEVLESSAEAIYRGVLHIRQQLRTNQTLAAAAIGFFYTLLLIKLVGFLIPAGKVKVGSGSEVELALQKAMTPLRDSLTPLLNLPQQLEQLSRKLTEATGKLEALAADRGDEDYLLEMGRNIHDIWKEIELIKSKAADNDISSNFNSFTSKIEARAFRPAIPEELTLEDSSQQDFVSKAGQKPVATPQRREASPQPEAPKLEDPSKLTKRPMTNIFNKTKIGAADSMPSSNKKLPEPIPAKVEETSVAAQPPLPDFKEEPFVAEPLQGALEFNDEKVPLPLVKPMMQSKPLLPKTNKLGQASRIVPKPPTVPSAPGFDNKSSLI